MVDAGHMSGGKPVIPSPPEEPLYTLEQAQAHLAQRECMQHGHDYEFVVDAVHNPQSMWCGKCYRKWVVTDA